MFKILIIADPKLAGGDLLERIAGLCETGTDAVLLRAKFLSEEEFRALAISVKQICDKFGREFIINQFFNVACELKSSFWLTSAQIDLLQNFSDTSDEFGLNFAKFKDFKDMAAKFTAASPALKIYAPAHDPAQAEISAKFADILIASHIFATSCKAGLKPKGLDLIRKVKAHVNKQIYALGGINKLNFRSVLGVGADGICLMSEAMRCENEREFINGFLMGAKD
ncbi:thiamine phosphate synthase [Campylobacter curvus]|uniref:thiamine phosphate synthase n=1 Tax=Campylobacter curvus TaxID=200 RepID=UPI0014703DCD|nr:thiamine phosphate synthase [Campylobacter curvus]